jgi:hypothetical protein
MFCTPEIVEVIARKTNWYATKLLENAYSKTKIYDPALEGDEQK